MYYEIEGQLNMKTLIFDENMFIVGEKQYPYSEIESLKITNAPLFATYGILTMRTNGRDIAIPFPRSKKARLESALREFERLREKGELGTSGADQTENAAQPAKRVQTAESATGMDPYEELKKLKELLDMDIVTKEEFDAKKKQLLNL